MSNCIRGFCLVSAATLVSFTAATAALAQDEGTDPFGEPLGVEANHPFDGNSEAGDPFDAPAATPAPKPQPVRAAAPSSNEPTTPVFWATDRPEQSEFIQRILREPLKSLGLEFDGAPLEEVVNFVRDEYNVDVQLDITALDDLGLAPNEPVSVNLRNISLGAALRILLRQLELTYIISDEVLVITTEEEALTRLQVAVYPVGDLLAVKTGYEHDTTSDDNLSRPEDMDTLVDLIISTVASDTWVDNGGPEAEIRTMQPGLLVVSQTQDVHEQISRLLTALRTAKQHPTAVPHQGKTLQERRAEAESRMRAYAEGAEQDQGGGGAF